MSGKVVGWAMEQATGSPVTKLVLVKLADNANEEGVCWPSLALIIEHTELSRRTVQEHLGRLEELGLIRIERRDNGGASLPNLYHLAIPAPARRDKGAQVARPHEGAGSAPPVQPTTGGGAGDAPRVVQETARHIEEPSFKPSMNLHSDAPAGASEREGVPPIEGLTEWWKEFRKAIVETWPGAFPSDDEAKARKMFEKVVADVPPASLIACTLAHGAVLTERKAKRGDMPGPFMVKIPSNWLKDGGYQGYATDIQKAMEDEATRTLAMARAHVGLGSEIVQVLRDIGMSDAAMANLDGCTYLGGPQPCFTVVRPFQGEILRRLGAKLQRALGTEDLVIVLTGTERRSA